MIAPALPAEPSHFGDQLGAIRPPTTFGVVYDDDVGHALLNASTFPAKRMSQEY
jgi:hypothetical protein